MILHSILKNRKSFTKHKDAPDSREDLLEQINTEAGRYYKTPAGVVYPSVTTVTGLLTADAIKQWRKRVGEEEANRVSAKDIFTRNKIP